MTLLASCTTAVKPVLESEEEEVELQGVTAIVRESAWEWHDLYGLSVSEEQIC